MDESQFTNALVQTLENYRRCGVSRFVRSEVEAFPAEWDTALAELTSRGTGRAANAATQSAHSNPSHSTPSGTPPVTSPVAPPTPPAVGGDTQSGGIVVNTGAPANWSLPVLPEQERQSKLLDINARVQACRQCVNIVDFREQTVFGAGTLRPRICFMGEAPGADEDRQGQPFVGRAGQLLTKIINAMKLSREEVYILNALKCRPPQNRTPVPEEIDNCRSFVEAQLEVLQPEFIVCLGAVAVRSILQSTLSIGKLRGQFHTYRGATVVVTYHPSYLLRNEDAKRFVWDDMKMLMRKMGMESSP